MRGKKKKARKRKQYFVKVLYLKKCLAEMDTELFHQPSLLLLYASSYSPLTRTSIA